MQFSSYQQDIFSTICNSSQSVAVEARAGSGKTFTAVHAAGLLPKRKNLRIAFVAFNNHNVEELKTKLPSHVACYTTHAFGLANLQSYSKGKCKVDNRKMATLVRSAARMARWDNGEEEVATKAARDLVDKCRLTLNSPDSQWMTRHFGIFDPITRYCARNKVEPEPIIQKVQGIARRCLAASIDSFKKDFTLDFADMLSLPYNLQIPIFQKEVMFVDEAQDLNAAQHNLVLQAAKNGRVASIGDRFQSIQGFAGSDCKSFENLIEATKAATLPLPICYRCPVSHIELAQEIVPDIEWREDAPDGEVLTVTSEEFAHMPSAGDLVICRRNAPLLGKALALIKRGIQARVRGRDIAESLVAYVKDVDQIKAKDVAFSSDFATAFMEKARIFRNREVAMLDQDDRDAHDRADDRLECAEVLAGSVCSLDKLIQLIDGMFSDERCAVWLSTIHRAKGLEADRVFILNSKFVTDYDEDPGGGWRYQQEMNLRYVALTRSKQTLVLVEEENDEF